MGYVTPELRHFGSFVGLTKGTGGSCADGGGRSSNQVGGGVVGGGGTDPCGSSAGDNGATNSGRPVGRP